MVTHISGNDSDWVPVILGLNPQDCPLHMTLRERERRQALTPEFFDQTTSRIELPSVCMEMIKQLGGLNSNLFLNTLILVILLESRAAEKLEAGLDKWKRTMKPDTESRREATVRLLPIMEHHRLILSSHLLCSLGQGFRPVLLVNMASGAKSLSCV